jgi:hypothetical protein
MGFFDVLGRLLGLVPDVIDAGTAIADAVKPNRKVDPADSTLWHTMRHWDDAGVQLGKPYCTVCQQPIPSGLRNSLCSEAVRRRQA